MWQWAPGSRAELPATCRRKSNGSVAGNGQRWLFYGAAKRSLEGSINRGRSAKLTFHAFHERYISTVEQAVAPENEPVEND